MKTATFIETERKNQNISHVVKKKITWQPAFDNLKIGDVFEAEFGVGGKTMDFEILYIIKDDDPLGLSDTVTFYMTNV